MKKSLTGYWRTSFHEFGEGMVNLFIFFPYFFSVPALIKTFFSPWKNLVSHKTSRGFDFKDWLSRSSFDLVSRLIGGWMRGSILVFFIIVQSIYVMALPFIFVCYWMLLPFSYLIYRLRKSDEEVKQSHRQEFVRRHCLKPENQYHVERWFEYYYRHFVEKKRWWKRDQLFTIPPLGRDWAQGYTPTLDNYSVDLTSQSYQAPIKRIFGREDEIKTIEAALTKNQSTNVLLIGEEGVGKHTLVDDLAYHIYSGQTNPLLAYKRLLKLNLEKILTQTTDQKQRENLLEVLLDEANQAKNAIILIDNLDRYIGAGTDRVDLSLTIEKMARSQHLQLIALTTPFFYQKDVYVNDRLNHIFTPIAVKEVTRAAAEIIMLDVALRYETHYRLTIPYETVMETVAKSDFYITAIPFPEKAIDLLDQACSRLVEIDKSKSGAPSTLLPKMVAETLATIAHVPTELSDALKDKLNRLQDDLNGQIISQPRATAALSAALRRSFVLLGKRKKPLAAFLFLGPTGVGKTETAKVLNRIFFGAAAIIRFDMSLYQTKDNVPQLIGAGADQPGLLTTALRNNPYGVLLLDEIEKADHDLLNILLTVLDEGYFTDGGGKRVDCKNLMIIATSNAGSDQIYQRLASTAPAVQTGDANQNQSTIINYLIENHLFSPEFLNRFDGVVVYDPIDNAAAAAIARMKVKAIVNDIYHLYKVKVTVPDALVESVISNAQYQQFGARDLERNLRQIIEDKIVKLILENRVKEGDEITLS
ncbi:AAA family ATPase [Patescibacteria group bacterium]|nr:AAA family ATPase [Patescibacteria group bacterium]MCL5091841.1 AAA family ATPase [Patescibacteria group bacterium]